MRLGKGKIEVFIFFFSLFFFLSVLKPWSKSGGQLTSSSKIPQLWTASPATLLLKLEEHLTAKHTLSISDTRYYTGNTRDDSACRAVAEKHLGIITTNHHDQNMQLQRTRRLWLLYSRHGNKFGET